MVLEIDVKRVCAIEAEMVQAVDVKTLDILDNFQYD